MLHIFISYSRQSQEIVKALVQDIEALGHAVWFDQELTGGQVWWDQVLTRIRECDLFVFALAPEALDSYACKLEYTYAFNLHKTILPILVADDVSINLLPPALSMIQFVDYRHQDKQAVFAFLKALNNLPAPQPLPAPLPKSPEAPISYLGNLKNEIETIAVLSFQEQTALLLKLKERLREVAEFNDALNLLARLRKRDDLYAKVAEEIDILLINTKAAPSDPQSTSATRTSPRTRLPSAKSEPSKVDELKAIVKEYSSKIKDDHIFFTSNIPQQKLQNALQTYAKIENNEEILSMIDDTVWGGAKDGALLTTKKIYAHNIDGSSQSFGLNDIQTVSFFGNYLHINNTKFLQITQPGEQGIRFFIEMLTEIIKQV